MNAVADFTSEKHTASERAARLALSSSVARMPLDAFEAFPRHIRRQDAARFLARYELFKQVLAVHGSIAEVGVYKGAGLFSWLHFSSILEPFNYQRRIIGFDTFDGFASIAEQDTKTGTSGLLYEGALSERCAKRLENLALTHDMNRPLGHIPKIELVKGDVCETARAYVREHPHLLLAMLYIDCDLYKPTSAALATLAPRVVPGGIIAFDELNDPGFPGETIAALGYLGKLQRFPFDPSISYFVKETP